MGIETLLLGGAFASGAAGVIGSNRAADAQVDASNASIAEQRRQFNTILDLTSPQRQVGNAALNTLASAFIPGFTGIQTSQPTTTQTDGQQREVLRALGVDTSRIPITTQTTPGQTLDPVNANQLSELFRNLPGTQFAIDEANRQVGNSFAARGGAFSGNAIRALGDRQAQIANDRVFNNLFQLAGFGPQGTSIASQGAANTGNNIAGLLSNQGAARASGFQGSAGSINNAIQGGLQNYLLLQALGG